MSSEIPRHIRIAIASATEAFEQDNVVRLGTFNEDLQPLIDAAVAWGRRGAKMRPAPLPIENLLDKLQRMNLDGEFSQDRDVLYWYYETSDNEDAQEILNDTSRDVRNALEGQIDGWEICELWTDNDSTGFELRRLS